MATVAQREATAKLISTLGGQSAVARLLGITPSAVNQWQRAGAIPPERVVDLVVEARKRGFWFDENALRPDVFKPITKDRRII